MSSTRQMQIAAARRWLGAAIVIVLACGCQGRFGAAINGSGVIKTEKREVAAFTRIDVGDAIRLEWQPGDKPGLEATADDNLLPHLVTELKGDTLAIRFDASVSPTKPVMVKATSAGLDEFSGSGASQGSLKHVKSDKFRLQLHGSSNCAITGQAATLTVECSGASRLKAADFPAGSATVAVSGASSAELQVKDLKSVHAAGASHATIEKIEAEQLKIELAGTSHCKLEGKVGKLTIDGDGAAAVHGFGLKADHVDVSLAGTSRVEIDAGAQIKGAAGGASRIEYHGEAAAQVQTSGVAKVVKKQ